MACLLLLLFLQKQNKRSIQFFLWIDSCACVSRQVFEGNHDTLLGGHDEKASTDFDFKEWSVAWESPLTICDMRS